MDKCAFSILAETADQADVEHLMQISDIVAAQLYPGEYRRPLNSKTLNADNIIVFMARDHNGKAAGCCVLFMHQDGTGELKRMIVDPCYRQKGIGAYLVQAVLTAAKSKNISLIQLEVGIKNVEAQALYIKMGFSKRDAFGTYKPSPVSIFMERKLDITVKESQWEVCNQ